MKCDGGYLDSQSYSGRFVVVTFDQQLQKAQFMWGKFIVSSVGRAYFAKEFDHATRNFWRHWRSTTHGFLQTLDQECRRSVFQQITASSRAQCVKDHFIIVIDGEHQ